LAFCEFISASRIFEKEGDWWTSLDVLNKMEYMDKCIYETIRLAQQSITLRVVRKPITFTQGLKVYTVPPGFYLATLLNVMNCRPPAVPDISYPPQEFHPERYEKGKVLDCPASHDYVVSTFGHSKHACPGRLYALYLL